MTMSIEQEFKALIDGMSGIQKAAFTTAPEGYQAPYIICTKISSPREETHDAASDTVRSRLQVDVYAADYKQAKTIAIALYPLRNSSSDAIHSINLDNENDSYDAATKLHRIILDFRVDHYETI